MVADEKWNLFGVFNVLIVSGVFRVISLSVFV